MAAKQSLRRGSVRPIYAVRPTTLEATLRKVSASARAFAKVHGYGGEAGVVLVLPSPQGQVEAILLGLGSASTSEAAFLAGKLATSIPSGEYRLEDWPVDPVFSAIAFQLGAYRFERYRKRPAQAVRLLTPPAVDNREVQRIVAGISLARDLINAPANDLGPSALQASALALARRHKARSRSWVGNQLLKSNFPLIHAVGRAAKQEPRLIELVSGKASHPKVTLVGKGVCFDTGGLDIKPASAMALMKKDMGGAAVALAAAHMIMDAKLPVRLRVLLPIVENAIAGDAFRPGDILQSRKGLTVEIGNTDAEGRLILADALSFACEDKPSLLIDFATLTGAARVALGPDLPAFYAASDQLAGEIAEAGAKMVDPVWRMPLWQPYMSMMESKCADLNNASASPFAGSITAALFLSRFVDQVENWAHFDIYGWNPVSRPGRPEGGEAQAARLVYELVRSKFGAAPNR
ncbi:MAG: leucyl aminopeptidase family protein [Beijerinckiaceae bacterium]